MLYLSSGQSELNVYSIEVRSHLPQPSQPFRHSPCAQTLFPDKESVAYTLCNAPSQQHSCVSIRTSLGTRILLYSYSEGTTRHHNLGESGHYTPDKQKSARHLHSRGERVGPHDTEERMHHLKDGNRLGECEEGMQRFVKAIEVVVGEEKRNEEDGSECYDAPQHETNSVVCEKVVFP